MGRVLFPFALALLVVANLMMTACSAGDGNAIGGDGCRDGSTAAELSDCLSHQFDCDVRIPSLPSFDEHLLVNIDGATTTVTSYHRDPNPPSTLLMHLRRADDSAPLHGLTIGDQFERIIEGNTVTFLGPPNSRNALWNDGCVAYQISLIGDDPETSVSDAELLGYVEATLSK
jgi:hypothetical protein